MVPFARVASPLAAVLPRLEGAVASGVADIDLRLAVIQVGRLVDLERYTVEQLRRCRRAWGSVAAKLQLTALRPTVPWTLARLAPAQFGTFPTTEVTGLVVFTRRPVTIPSLETFMENVQPAPGASVAPNKEIPPLSMLMIPPLQLPAKPLGVEMTSPAGNTSENAMEFRVGNWLGFVIENVMDVEPLARLCSCPKRPGQGSGRGFGIRNGQASEAVSAWNTFDGSEGLAHGLRGSLRGIAGCCANRAGM